MKQTTNQVNGTSKRDAFKELLEYAVLAPSGHNAQPWLFQFNEQNDLLLIADRTRALPVVDPYDREMTISCGALLDHLEITAQAHGRGVKIDICPNVADDDILARVRMGADDAQNMQDLFAAIQTRRTTRAKFEDRTLPDDLAVQCQDIADQFGMELTLISDIDRRSAIADLVAEGDRIQFSDPSFRRELAAWVHSRRGASQDGMSGSGFGMPDILSPIGALVIRTFDIGNGIAAGDKNKILEGSPTLAVFSSPGDTPDNWMQTGRALSRVLLTLAANGVTASYLNPPVELTLHRPKLQSIVGSIGTPQLLMRFGYGPNSEPTVRRDVEQVLLDE